MQFTSTPRVIRFTSTLLDLISVLIFHEKYKLRSFMKHFSILLLLRCHTFKSSPLRIDTHVKFSVKGHILLQTKTVKCLRCKTHTAEMLATLSYFVAMSTATLRKRVPSTKYVTIFLPNDMDDEGQMQRHCQKGGASFT